jgi:glucosylceramidase
MFIQYVTSKYTNHRHSNVSVLQSKEYDETIVVDSQITYQTIIGFGGAFTEASAFTLSKISANQRDEVINAYYNEDTGLHYTIGRVHINSCDFSLDNYDYVDEYDTTLDSFDISRELDYVIPLIKDAEEIAKQKISLLASPWSPPAWMKSNKQMNNGGYLLPEYYEVWARYYVKFIDEFKKHDLNIDYVSVQNEPAAKQTWDSCIYSAEDERDFVRYFLGPILHEKYPDVKIIIWDHNRDVIVERADTVLRDKEARKHVWGTGVHWYVSEEFDNLSEVHNLHPDKHILFTEGCIEGGVHLNDYSTGERYARNMIGDFRNYCEGYLDWNITLNEHGGPNHVGNYCDAPIITDTVKKEIIYNSSFYYISHFSRHVLPGSVRTFSDSSCKDLKHIAFMALNREKIIIVLNETENDYKVKIQLDKKDYFVEIPRRSISTLIEKE